MIEKDTTAEVPYTFRAMFFPLGDTYVADAMTLLSHLSSKWGDRNVKFVLGYDEFGEFSRPYVSIRRVATPEEVTALAEWDQAIYDQDEFYRRYNWEDFSEEEVQLNVATSLAAAKYAAVSKSCWEAAGWDYPSWNRGEIE